MSGVCYASVGFRSPFQGHCISKSPSQVLRSAAPEALSSGRRDRPSSQQRLVELASPVVRRPCVSVACLQKRRAGSSRLRSMGRNDSNVGMDGPQRVKQRTPLCEASVTNIESLDIGRWLAETPGRGEDLSMFDQKEAAPKKRV